MTFGELPPFVLISLVLLAVYVVTQFIHWLSSPSPVHELSDEERREIRARTATAALTRRRDRVVLEPARETANDNGKGSNGHLGMSQSRRDPNEIDGATATATAAVATGGRMNQSKRKPKETDVATVGRRNRVADADVNVVGEMPATAEVPLETEENKSAHMTDEGKHQHIKKKIRQATFEDRAKWDEERNSQSQFGFSIHGHQGACQSCGGHVLQTSSSSVSIPTGFDPIQSISSLPHLPMAGEALANLERLRREFEPVVRARGWTVLALTEMCCCGDGDESLIGASDSGKQSSSKGPNVMGYCSTTGNGRTALGIHIRLRPHGSCNLPTLIPYHELVPTMAHELAHIAEANHNTRFYQIMAQIERQRLEFMAGGAVLGEDGFPVGGMGHRLGGGGGQVLGRRELRRRVAESAQQRQNDRGSQPVMTTEQVRQTRSSKRTIATDLAKREERLRAVEQRCKRHKNR